MRNTPDVRVTLRPNGSHPGHFLAAFEEDCPFCGKRHTGHGTTGVLFQGSYGQRVPHCSSRDHAKHPHEHDDSEVYRLVPVGCWCGRPDFHAHPLSEVPA